MFKTKSKFKAFDNFPESICIIDKSEKIIYSNKKAEGFVKLFRKNVPKILMQNIIEQSNSNKSIRFNNYTIKSKDYEDHFLLIIRDITSLENSLHDIRHDIKNQLNSIILIESDKVDVQKIVSDVVYSIDSISINSIIPYI